MDNAKVTIVYGVLLILLGVIGYVVTDRVSVTALIPAFFGVVLLVLGVLAGRGVARKHLLHIGAVLGFVGFLATVAGLVEVLTGWMSPDDAPVKAAQAARAIMAVLSLVFVVLMFKSFVDARRNRSRSAAPQRR